MRRTRTCKPSLSKSTRCLVSTSASRNDPRRVSSSLHGALPASATSTGPRTASSSGLGPATVASGAPGASAGARLAADCSLPNPDARVDGGTRERPRAPRARSAFCSHERALARSARRLSADRDETRARSGVSRYLDCHSVKRTTVERAGTGALGSAASRLCPPLERAYGYAEARCGERQAPLVATRTSRPARKWPC
jgi:hypothetical protein